MSAYFLRRHNNIIMIVDHGDDVNILVDSMNKYSGIKFIIKHIILILNILRLHYAVDSVVLSKLSTSS